MSHSKTDLPIIITKLREKFGEEVAAKTLYDHLCEEGIPAGWVLCPSRRVSRGNYSLLDDPSTVVKSTAVQRRAKRATVPQGLAAMIPNAVADEPAPVADVSNVTNLSVARAARMQLANLVPDINPVFVPFGHFRDIMLIIDSQIFYPAYVTGLSGNGKSEMIEQACARLKRNYIRVNITEETDEDDLIGGNTMVDGNIVFREGPVLTAMRTGSILLLDEVDLNSTKILCLQSIMEGKPYFNKKTGEHVQPVAGFNVFATANTKGRGSDTGRFIGTKMMNEAFLERFPITFEQEYPSANIEKKILTKNFAMLGCDVADTGPFVDNLVKWSEVIRKSYAEQAVDDLISTRRLVAIARAYAIFKDRMKALTLCMARFEGVTKEIFLDLYTKVDATVTLDAAKVAGDNEIDD